PLLGAQRRVPIIPQAVGKAPLLAESRQRAQQQRIIQPELVPGQGNRRVDRQGGHYQTPDRAPQDGRSLRALQQRQRGHRQQREGRVQRQVVARLLVDHVPQGPERPQ